MMVRSLSVGLVLAWSMSLAEAAQPAFAPGEAERLAAELHFKSQPWAQLPWQVSLSDALQVAASERKPIFMVVNTGNCLGYV